MVPSSRKYTPMGIDLTTRAVIHARHDRCLPMGTQRSGPARPHEHLGFRTTCGRDVQVGWLIVGGTQRPARRVSLDVGHSPGRDDGTWAALLMQAAAAEL